MGWQYEFKPYVPVAKRRAQAAKIVARRAKKGEVVTPIRIEGRKITTTFWGQAWCANLESYSDFANRLPRGRTYVRNGSVVDLKIEQGKIKALVSGSKLYEIQIDIAKLPKPTWLSLKQQSAGKIGTLVELLQGKLSKAVMELVTDRKQGLFPKPSEIKMRCSCPDYAGMCKHLAATLYGIGNRLDSEPELLFALRAVDHLELIEQAIPAVPVVAKSGAPTINMNDLGTIFDIELDESPDAPTVAKTSKKRMPKKSMTPAKKVKQISSKAKKSPAAKPKKAVTVSKKAIRAGKRQHN